MKFPLFLLFSLLCFNSFAQNCNSHALFQKGVQLEYNYHMAQFQGPEKKIMRLLFEVTDVYERNGSTFSAIVKRGNSLNSEKEHYERTIDLECDGKNLLIPFDFFTADTVYTKDVYPTVREKKGYAFAFTPLKNDATYIVPLKLEGSNKLPVGLTRYVQKGKQRSWSDRSLRKFDFENIITIKSIRLIGKETVKTDAGAFECYKFYVDTDCEIGKRSLQLKYWLYFNNEVGLVKYDGPGGFIELVSVKK